MDKFQSIRVEWLAADIAVVRIIEKITGKRMTDIAHMDPDLMSPAGIQFQTDIRKILFFIIGEKTVMGQTIPFGDLDWEQTVMRIKIRVEC